MAGSVEMTDTAGLKEYYGPAPNLQFLESTWPGATNEQLNEASFGAPDGMTPEDKVRYLERRLPPKNSPLLQDVLRVIHRKFDEEGPFDCILGHSEGAVIAATFVVDRLQKSAEANNIATPGCAVFFNGAAPHTADGKRWLLADEYGQLIAIPTCHFTAYNDPMADSAVALYHLCDEALANVIDHGRGHAIPKDDKSCKLMIGAIRDLMDRTRSRGRT